MSVIICNDCVYWSSSFKFSCVVVVFGCIDDSLSLSLSCIVNTKTSTNRNAHTHKTKQPQTMNKTEQNQKRVNDLWFQSPHQSQILALWQWILVFAVVCHSFGVVGREASKDRTEPKALLIIMPLGIVLLIMALLSSSDFLF